MPTYLDYEAADPVEPLTTYRTILEAHQTDLNAVSLFGAGTLTTPGESARDALKACTALALHVDTHTVSPRFKAAISGIESEAQARAVDFVGSLDPLEAEGIDTEAEKRAAIAEAFQRYRERLVRRTVIAIVEKHGDRGIQKGRIAVDALKQFEQAIEGFGGDPGELAIAEAAQVECDRIAGELGIRTIARVPDPERGRVNPDWLATSLVFQRHPNPR